MAATRFDFYVEPKQLGINQGCLEASKNIMSLWIQLSAVRAGSLWMNDTTYLLRKYS
jgi:hypothetical protein